MALLEDIQNTYQSTFGTSGDQAGIDYWMDAINDPGSGITLENLQESFVNANPEEASNYAQSIDDPRGYVESKYQNIFGRGGDSGGLDYWTRALTSGDTPINAQNLEASMIEAGKEDVEGDPQLYQPDLFPESRTGIGQGYIDQIMGAVVPNLTESIEGREQDIENLTGQAVNLSKNVSRDLLGDTLQGMTSSLENRGILNSTVAGDVMGTATGEVLSNISNQVYQAGMEGAKLNLGTTDLLRQVAGLGQVSESKDPSVPQRILASTYLGL